MLRIPLGDTPLNPPDYYDPDECEAITEPPEDAHVLERETRQLYERVLTLTLMHADDCECDLCGACVSLGRSSGLLERVVNGRTK